MDHRGPGLRRQRHGIALLPATLRIGQLAVGHARRNRIRQIVEIRHLRAGRRQQRLFTRPARHRPRPQVRNKGPGGKDAATIRVDDMAQNQPRQHLGTGLRHSACQRGRGRGPRLPRRHQQDRHARQNRRLQRIAAFRGKAHRRHDMATDRGAERPRAVLALAPRNSIQHRLHRTNRRAVGIAHRNGFCGPRKAGIGGVHIQIEDTCRIPRHDRPMIPVDIVQPVHQTGNVIQIRHRAFAVAAGVEIHDRRRRPTGAGMHPPPANLDIMQRVDAVQRKAAARARDHVFHQPTGKAQPPVAIHPAPRRNRPRFKAGGQLRQTKVFKQGQNQVVDLQDLGIGQRLVTAPDHTCRHGRWRHIRLDTVATTGTARRNFGHGGPSERGLAPEGMQSTRLSNDHSEWVAFPDVMPELPCPAASAAIQS